MVDVLDFVAAHFSFQPHFADALLLAVGREDVGLLCAMVQGEIGVEVNVAAEGEAEPAGQVGVGVTFAGCRLNRALQWIGAGCVIQRNDDRAASRQAALPPGFARQHLVLAGCVQPCPGLVQLAAVERLVVEHRVIQLKTGAILLWRRLIRVLLP